MARLRDGASVADARAELTGLIADLPQAYPGDPLALGERAGHRALFGDENTEGRDDRERRACALDPARLGGSRAARRVRQRRQPVPGALRGTTARSRRSPCAGCGPLRHRTLLPHGERAAFDRRRRGRPRPRLGWRAAARALWAHDTPAPRRSPAGRRRRRVHIGAEPAVGVRVWRDSVVARRAARGLTARKRARQHARAAAAIAPVTC